MQDDKEWNDSQLKGNAYHIINELWKKGFIYQISLLQILAKSIKKLRSYMHLKFPLFLLWKPPYLCVYDIIAS